MWSVTLKVYLLLHLKRAVDLVTVHRNCEDWRLHRYTDSGFYHVDPAGGGTSFRVECDLTSNPARTIIHHDKEPRTYFDRGSTGGSLTLPVTYWISLDQIDAVKGRAISCSQYVKLDCYRERITFSNNQYRWQDRHSQTRKYWGDVTDFNGYCECGLAGNCQGGGKCNCGVGDTTWRYDDGHLVDMSVLPLTQLESSNLGNHERGYHTIGPLICVDDDPRRWVETPEGATITFVISVLSFILIVMTIFVIYQRRLWRKCTACKCPRSCKKKQNVTVVEPVGPTPRTVLSEKPPSPLTSDSLRVYSSSVKRPPMSPSVIPISNYEMGVKGRDLDSLRRNFYNQYYSSKNSRYQRTYSEERPYSVDVMTPRSPPYKTTINSPQPWEKGEGPFPWETGSNPAPPAYSALTAGEISHPHTPAMDVEEEHKADRAESAISKSNVKLTDATTS